MFSEAYASHSVRDVTSCFWSHGLSWGMWSVLGPRLGCKADPLIGTPPEIATPPGFWHLVVATATVGTQPTGMHSCSSKQFTISAFSGCLNDKTVLGVHFETVTVQLLSKLKKSLLTLTSPLVHGVPIGKFIISACLLVMQLLASNIWKPFH